MVKRDAREHKENLAKGKEQISKFEALVVNEPAEINTAEIDRQMVSTQTGTTWTVQHLTELRAEQNGKLLQRNDVKQSAQEARHEYERIVHRADQIKRSTDEDKQRYVARLSRSLCRL